MCSNIHSTFWSYCCT